MTDQNSGSLEVEKIGRKEDWITHEG